MSRRLPEPDAHGRFSVVSVEQDDKIAAAGR